MSADSGRRSAAKGSYKDVYNHFAELIDDGQLVPGDRLPSLPEIEREYGISHVTASKALRLLRDGLYVRTGWFGAVVRSTKEERLFQHLCNALNTLEADGQQLQLEMSRTGVCIMGRDGGVCWNEESRVWELVTD